MVSWTSQAISKINADYQRSADTHLIKLDRVKIPGVDLYLKDESTHPTGSLKHRLARSLFLYALCNGKIKQDTIIVEASSGSTAVSEAYFARMIGVPFIAVMPRSTAQSKISLIEQFGGQCHFVDCSTQMHDEAISIARAKNGYFMDQFMYAAGTGGTSATIGRYIRYKGLPTTLTVVDPEHSVFFQSYTQNDLTITADRGSKIEGIGRPKVEASFQADVIDHMIKVPDAASVAAMKWLATKIGIKAGPSTGTNLWGALNIAKRMSEEGQTGSVVTLMCDSGARYQDTYYNNGWVEKEIGDIAHYAAQLGEYHLA